MTHWWSMNVRKEGCIHRDPLVKKSFLEARVHKAISSLIFTVDVSFPLAFLGTVFEFPNGRFAPETYVMSNIARLKHRPGHTTFAVWGDFPTNSDPQSSQVSFLL